MPQLGYQFHDTLVDGFAFADDWVVCAESQARLKEKLEAAAVDRIKEWCGQPESLVHILQFCWITHDARCARHNRVARELAKRLRRLGYTVFEELRAPTSTSFIKPDLIAVRERRATVIDVSIVSDGRGVTVWNEKKQKYGADEFSLAIISALRAIGCDVDFLVHQPMIISYRGICFPQSAKAVIGLGLSNVTVSDLCLLAIVGSLQHNTEICVQHTNICMLVQSTLKYNTTERYQETTNAEHQLKWQCERRSQRTDLEGHNCVCHLWHQKSISLGFKRCVYQITVQVVTLYGSESRPIRVDDLRCFQVFENRCVKMINCIGWNRRIRYETSRRTRSKKDMCNRGGRSRCGKTIEKSETLQLRTSAAKQRCYTVKDGSEMKDGPSSEPRNSIGALRVRRTSSDLRVVSSERISELTLCAATAVLKDGTGTERNRCIVTIVEVVATIYKNKPQRKRQVMQKTTVGVKEAFRFARILFHLASDDASGKVVIAVSSKDVVLSEIQCLDKTGFRGLKTDFEVFRVVTELGRTEAAADGDARRAKRSVRMLGLAEKVFKFEWGRVKDGKRGSVR
ncbi:retrovirus-related Pol polyprotein from type-1 retrotransposable element R2, partial [Clonorchis sinensis]